MSGDSDENGTHLNGAPLPLENEEDVSPLVERPPRMASAAPPNVAELAASCARYVHAKYGVPLDGTSDTLGLLDQYVKDARAAVTLQPASLRLLEATVGAYFGEVLRRAFPSSWFSSGEHDAWRLDFEEVYLTFNPIGMAREALMLTEAEGWHAHLEMDDAEQDEILSRLERLPEVSDEEFYSPSTRYDVVEIAVEALLARAHADGLADVHFTAEDYRRK